ncbi:MAG: hypothetical protein AAFO07_07650 [Bacteroidota bacterium]
MKALIIAVLIFSIKYKKGEFSNIKEFDKLPDYIQDGGAETLKQFEFVTDEYQDNYPCCIAVLKYS